jgi:UDP-glucose 4-epimerase
VSNSNVTFNRKTEHKNDVKKTMADTQYIQSLIKSKPSTDLETGILETIKWASNSEINPLIESWIDSVPN